MLYSVFNSPDTDMLIIWLLIPDTWYLTLVLDMLTLDTWYLTLDIWHQYLTCYHLTPDTWHLISDTGIWHVDTWHLILDTWYLIPVLDMLSLDTNTWHLIYDTWQLTCYHLIIDICYHLVLAYLTWNCDIWLNTIIPGTCITLHIHDYHFYGDLAWLLYCYQTSSTPELQYSWTLVSTVLMSLALLLLLIAGHTSVRQSMSSVRITRMYPTIVLASSGSWIELSATQSKMPHHTRGGGAPLESVGGTSRIHSPHRIKCHMEQSTTPHMWWGPPLESVGLPPACDAWC